MSPAITAVNVIPDLALLICPEDPDPYDLTFYDRHWMHFLRHDQQIGTCGFKWALSEDLVNLILQQLPWAAMSTVEWVRLMIISLEEMRRHIPPRVVPTRQSCTVLPDIVPQRAAPGTTEAWRDLVVWCIEQSPAKSGIASHADQTVTELRVQVDPSQPTDIIGLVRDPPQWDELLKKVNPWAGCQLPENGDYAYVPPSSWRAGQAFPKARATGGEGFQDKEGRIWLWDRMECHWDVQLQPLRRDNYMRITPDGLWLDKPTKKVHPSLVQ